MKKHYYFIGIGGIGMSGIAKLLLRSGQKVSGSDLKESEITRELKLLGANIFIGHKAQNLNSVDCIVYSSAISEDNPEMIEAKKRHLPILKRAEALAGLMQEKTVITIAGSHGKTTTASLASLLLLEAGLSPTVAVGGILQNIDTNASLGKGDFFVAEADESDGSFLYYQPRYSIVTNIDFEHLDFYKEFSNELAAFKEFINKTEDGGCIFACKDDTNLQSILKGCDKRHLFFGLDASADIYPKDIVINGLTSEFICCLRDKDIGRFHLALGGRHNISNSLAVIALGLELGIDLKMIQGTLASYKGSRRRLQVKHSGDYILIDDYAHHPTEISATLQAIKNLNPKRIIALFQPHRYSRTKLLLGEFSNSFGLADYLIITDIYPAGEKNIEGISSKSIYDNIKLCFPDKELYCLAKEELVPRVLGIIRPGDLVITLGAGDITKVSDELAERFKG
ncbi:MAG: UDP-N-acetylmuramate--L-alanine ligase [Candidatus Omnitrophota bacterium]